MTQLSRQGFGCRMAVPFILNFKLKKALTIIKLRDIENIDKGNSIDFSCTFLSVQVIRNNTWDSLQ